jgi:uncharacterized protein (TIGR02270 family)
VVVPLHPNLHLNSSAPAQTVKPSHVARPPIPVVVMQHVEEAAHLRHVRSVLVRAPHVRLLQLGRIDERIAAHLDGVAVAGAYGSSLAQEALAECGKGQIFVATVRALEERDMAVLDKVIAIAEAEVACRPGLLSAFAWVSTAALQGIVKPLLEASSPWRQIVGLAACTLHGVDPGAPLAQALTHADLNVRTRAVRAAGELGRADLLPDCIDALRHVHAACRLAAARSALLLGNRLAALQTLRELALQPGDEQLPALALALLAMDTTAARALVRQLAAAGASLRILIKASGWAGDVHTVPWLLKHMADDTHARLAGESFSLITGADLAKQDLERQPPKETPSGPNEDADDDNVAMDEDDSLPWPDPVKVQTWWAAHQGQFGADTHLLLGTTPTAGHCLHVLKTGSQRQRFLAAISWVLAQPARPLFNCAAPAWRQHRTLAALIGSA